MEGQLLERLDIEARMLFGGLIKIALWEDGMSWVYCRERPKKTPTPPKLDIRANLSDMSVEELAEFFRATLRDPQAMEKEWKQRALAAGGT